MLGSFCSCISTISVCGFNRLSRDSESATVPCSNCTETSAVASLLWGYVGEGSSQDNLSQATLMGAYYIPILSAHSIRHIRWQPLQHCAQAHMRFCQQYREATKSSTTSVGTRMAAATADPLSASSHGIAKDPTFPAQQRSVAERFSNLQSKGCLRTGMGTKHRSGWVPLGMAVLILKANAAAFCVQVGDKKTRDSITLLSL